MGKASLSRPLLGRIASPGKCKNQFVQEARHEVDELTKMDEMALMKIPSVNFGPTSDQTLWTREAQHIHSNRSLANPSKLSHILSPSPYVVLVELLASGNHGWRHTMQRP